MDAQSIKVACSSCNLRELCLPMGLNPDEMSKLDQLLRGIDEVASDDGIK